MIERARPMLGTIASVRAAPPPYAIDDAFAAISKVQSIMSAFEAGSDLTRLHDVHCGQVVSLHPLMRQVLAFGLALSEVSDGLFDIALGGEAAARGTFPQPVHARYELGEVQNASWRDIELSDDGILLKRPLWLDLSGIAKGFAVDQGLAALREAGATQGTVNIGGDLAVFGPDRETVHLRIDSDFSPPEIDIENAAIASSGGATNWVKTRHFHGRTRDMISPHRFASVIAPDCMTADALTKVLLACETVDPRLLARYSARAICYDAANGWQIFGEDDG